MIRRVYNISPVFEKATLYRGVGTGAVAPAQATQIF